MPRQPAPQQCRRDVVRRLAECRAEAIDGKHVLGWVVLHPAAACNKSVVGNVVL